jgi:16S rRNA (guanine527-N7)-methyltransferase
MSDPAAVFGPSLDRLGQRFGLDAREVEQLRGFGAVLVNDEHAPTTVRDPGRVRDDHLADALVALELPLVQRAAAIADLGAGAGVPGIPLAIALPEARVTLIEGNGRKCEFMAGVIESLGLGNAEVVNGRAETWSAGVGRHDVVTARALGPLDVVAEYAAPLLSLGGALVAWRGARDPQSEADALRAAEILGLAVEQPIHVNPYKGAENRYLHVMVKVAETPSRFPRRDGVARKRPLGRI